MLQTTDQLAAIIRTSAPRAVLGIIVLTIGLAALAIFAFRKRSKDPAIVWFGCFSALYGVRLLIQTKLVVLALGMGDLRNAYLEAGLTYVLPSFGTLFLYSVFPRWRRIFLWLLSAQIALGVAGLICDQVFHQPFVLNAPNNLLVIGAIALLCYLLSRVEQSFDIRALRLGVLFFSATVIVANVGGLLRRNLDFEPIGFAVYLSCLGAVLIERSTRIKERLTVLEEELAIARRIQTSILPRELPQSASLTIAARYVPMTAVAGDFYDFLILDESCLGVLVADVSGHGVPAALIASMIKVAAAAQLSGADDPARVIRGMNQTLCPNLQGQFVTAAYLFLDLYSQVLRYAAAAHPRLLWLHRASLEVEAVEENGLLIGVMASAAYTAVERSFQRGDRFLLYTDGLLEATNKNEEFYEEDQLKEALAASANLKAGESAEFILRELAEWGGYDAGRLQEDDLTLLVVDVAGE